MFGYLRCDKPELKFKEYETYRSVYCTLCRSMGRRYGRLSRMFLSYDLTFLCLLGLSLREEGCTYEQKHCVCNPLKKCSYCVCEAAVPDYCAAVTVVLAYFKCRDDCADRGFFASLPARVAGWYLARQAKKAARDFPSVWETVSGQMARQTELEREQTASVDAAADSSARTVAALTAFLGRDERERRVLDRVGYCVGRWVYLIDAADDLGKDLRRGSYNPFLLTRPVTPTSDLAAERAALEPTLTHCISEAAVAYGLLEPKRFSSILENILARGMPAVQQEILTKKD